MTAQPPVSSSKARPPWLLIIIALLLIGGIAALAYAWNSAQQAVTQAEIALATATANLAEIQNFRATAEAGQKAAQVEQAAAQATVTSVLAASAAAEATAQARQSEALAAAAAEADAQTRQAGAYRLAAEALANLPADPNRSLILAGEAVSASLAVSEIVPPEIAGALRQTLRANHLAGRLTAGHTGPVNDVAFSPDGSRLATVGDDGALRIWETVSGGELLTLTHASTRQPVFSVAFSPQGDRLVTTSFDHTAKIWDSETGQELLTLTGHKDWVIGVAFSPAAGQNTTGVIATSSQDGTAILWDASSGQALSIISQTAAINRLAFSPDGDRLATSSDDGTLTVWDTASGEALLTLEGHTGPVYDVAFNPAGDLLVSASIDGTLKIWESNTGEEVRTLRHNRAGWATSVVFSASGDWLASAGQDGRVVIWDVATGRERLTLTGPPAMIHGLAISSGSSSGELLASASADGQVRLWQMTEAETSLALPPLTNHRGPVYGVAATVSGNQLATSGSDGTVKIWQITPAESRLIRTLAPVPATEALYALAFGPDGTNVAAAGAEGTITVWETNSAETTNPQLRLTGHTGPIYALAFNPAGEQLASAGEDGTARLWDTATGEEVTVLISSTETDAIVEPVYSLAFNPNGDILATAGRDGLVKIWDVTSNEQIAELPGSGAPIRALIFHPALSDTSSDSRADDLLAVGGDDGSVRLWTLGQSVRLLPGASAAIQGLAFSPDHHRLAATSADGVVTSWSLVSGRALSRLTSPDGVMAGFGLTFLADGLSLVTGSQAISSGQTVTSADTVGMALRWNVAADELLNLYQPTPITGMALVSPAASTEDEQLVTLGEDGLVRSWQIKPASGRWSAVSAGEDGVLPASEKAILTSVAANRNYLAAGSNAGSVWLWAAGSGELLTTLPAHIGPINSLVLSDEGRLLISAGQDDTVKVWTIAPNNTIADRPLILRGHTGDIMSLALNPAGVLASASHDGAARLWEIESGQELVTLTGHSGWVNDLAFNTTGAYLATAGEDSTIRVWETASGRELLRLSSPDGVNGPIKQIAFGPGGEAGGERLAALAENGSMLVWLLTAEQTNRLAAPQRLLQLSPSTESKPNNLAFDSTGRALITAGDDGIVRFYALGIEDLLNSR